MKKIAAMGWIMLLIIGVSTCQRVRKATNSSADLQSSPSLPPVPRVPPLPPLIEITPLKQGRGQWRVATAEVVTVAVVAPGAERVQIVSRPENVEDGQFELPALTVPADRVSGRFVMQLKLAPDFAGELWGEAFYSDGSKRETSAIALTAPTISGIAPSLPSLPSLPPLPPLPPSPSLIATGGSVGTDESARSDKLTGGRIRKTRLIAGEPDIRITVNIPAFLLTLWQNGKEVKRYQIGIGRKNFPVPIGEREASQIVFNPSWISPNSGWVERRPEGEAYHKAEENRNPLGRIKIPLGGGYLIHETMRDEEIGRAASHGCIRMRGADILDLATKIISARNLPMTRKELNRVMQGRDRLALKLDAPLLVDINYDLQVVEGKVLHLYPDIYARSTFALESLRAELQGAGVDGSKLADHTLRQMIGHVGSGEQFVISLADIKRGRWNAGYTMQLTQRAVGRGRYIASSTLKPGRAHFSGRSARPARL